MSLKSEISVNYEDSNGLVAPRRCLHTDANPSGNGVCYTGELVSMLALRGELEPSDCSYFWAVMKKCMVQPGLLARGPGQPDLESVDDYYGFAAGCVATGCKDLAGEVISYGWRHLGSFNNIQPGKWTTASFLWRQPELLCALLAAGQRLPRWYRPWTWWQYPLRGYTAIIIATSCIGASVNEADSWRLNWLLIQAMSPASWACRKAATLWFYRLKRVCGPTQMRAVAATYYQTSPEHPFIQYWPL